MLREGAHLGVDVAHQQVDQVLGIATKAATDPSNATVSLTDWDLVNEDAVAWARQHAGDLARGLTDTTRARLRTAVGEYLSNSLTFHDLIDELQPMFGKERAQRIAVTEITTAYAQGNLAAWKRSGVITMCEWRTARDELVCPNCGPRDGQQFPVDEADAPPAHVRCRCWLVPVVTEPERPKYPFDPSKLRVEPDESLGLGGVHPKTVYRDENDVLWLFKPQDRFLSALDVATSSIARKADFAAAGAETYEITLAGQSGSIQRMFGTKATRRGAFRYGTFDPTKLDATDAEQLQRHAVFDWLISNHDAHSEQFVRVSGDRTVYGIDKGQAFKFFGQDRLDYAYNPNHNAGAGSVYNALYQAYAEGKGVKIKTLASNAELTTFVEKLQALPDGEYRALLQRYAQAAKRDPEAFLDAAVARKNSLLTDWTAYHERLETERAAALAPRNGLREFHDDAAGAQWAAETWPSAHGFSAEQVSALRSYKGSGYSRINDGLREGRRAAREVKHIDEALKKYPFPDDTIVWRGVGTDAFPGGADAFVGGEWSDKGYMSTSIGATPAFSHRPIWMRIRVPKGTPTYYMEHLTAMNERELLLPRGQTFLVKSVTSSGGHQVVELEMLP